MSMVHRSNRSFPDLIADLFGQLTHLFRKEIELARTEVSENVSSAISGLVMIIAGAVLLIPALVILLQGGVSTLIERGFEAHWAALIVGGATLLIGIILAMIGVSRLKAENLVPKRTIEQLQRDAAVAKEQVR
jgi:hypothetical protein